MSAAQRPLAVAVGDPAGVGPEVSLRGALALAAEVPCLLFGDAAQIGRLAQRMGATERVQPLVESNVSRLASGRVGLVDTGSLPEAVIALHEPHPACGRAQLHTLDRAARAVLAGQARALVTGPTSKAAIVAAGEPFTGQTEFLARLDHRGADEVSMLFLGPRLNVGLVTTHLSVADVPAAITRPRVERAIRHLASAVLRRRGELPSVIQVAGLNPHAGELGLFGREEIDVIAPAVVALRAELSRVSASVTLEGPLPAESVFRAAQRGEAHGVVAMFHDQATIAAKLLDWGSSVNTTWGLSFLRTSVDHGVAYAAARDGSADDRGMRAALAMAVQLTREEHG